MEDISKDYDQLCDGQPLFVCVCVCVWNIRVNVVTLLMTLSLLCFDFKTCLHIFVCKYFNGDALFLLKELLVMGES